jgi:hypothetical protein
VIHTPEYLQPSQDVIWDEIDGVVTLCNTETIDFFKLNEVAGFIWKACCSKCSRSDIIMGLGALYPGERLEKLVEETNTFLSALAEAGLLVK